MNKKTITSIVLGTALTSLSLVSQADQVRDSDLSGPFWENYSQSDIESFKNYQRAMSEKYEELNRKIKVEEHKQAKRYTYHNNKDEKKYDHGYIKKRIKSVEAPMGLSEYQEAFINDLNDQKHAFLMMQEEEKERFMEGYWGEINKILTPRQAKILRMHKEEWRKNNGYGDYFMKRPSGYKKGY